MTRSIPFLRQDSSTAPTTMPRTNAGIFFMRSAAASSQAMVFGDSAPYSIAVFPSAPAADVRQRWRARGNPGERPGRVGAERIFGHQIAGHPEGPGAAAAAVAVHLALPASPAERGALANAGEQLRGRPEVREARVAKRSREDREVGARRDIPVRPDPHVVRARRAPAGASGVGPDRAASRRSRRTVLM